MLHEEVDCLLIRDNRNGPDNANATPIGTPSSNPELKPSPIPLRGVVTT